VLVAALWGVGCGALPYNDLTCQAFKVCYEQTGGTKGEFDPLHGPMGTCWTSTRAVADACTAQCTAKLTVLKQTLPDAGCEG